MLFFLFKHCTCFIAISGFIPHLQFLQLSPWQVFSVQNSTILSISGGKDLYTYQQAHFCYTPVENSVQTSQDSTACMRKATNLKKVYPIIASFSYLAWLDEELPSKLAKVTSGRTIVDTFADAAMSFQGTNFWIPKQATSILFKTTVLV